MKMPGAVNILFLSFLLSSCTLPPKVDSHYDSDFDFSSLKHYRWFELPGDVEADDITIRRLRHAVDHQMEMKGYALSPKEPDFLISLRGFKETVTQGTAQGPSIQSETASAIGSGTYNQGLRRHARYGTVVHEAGTLTLTITNAADEQLIWEGIVTGLIKSNNSPESREQRTNKTIARLLANFPPTEK
ncbi:MAG: DUF4136 domain-containing protein [Planctomycetota bacterium]|jgi:hypothetical protein